MGQNCSHIQRQCREECNTDNSCHIDQNEMKFGPAAPDCWQDSHGGLARSSRSTAATSSCSLWSGYFGLVSGKSAKAPVYMFSAWKATVSRVGHLDQWSRQKNAPRSLAVDTKGIFLRRRSVSSRSAAGPLCCTKLAEITASGLAPADGGRQQQAVARSAERNLPNRPNLHKVAVQASQVCLK
eukprot:s4878_g5.t1